MSSPAIGDAIGFGAFGAFGLDKAAEPREAPAAIVAPMAAAVIPKGSFLILNTLYLLLKGLFSRRIPSPSSRSQSSTERVRKFLRRLTALNSDLDDSILFRIRLL